MIYSSALLILLFVLIVGDRQVQTMATKILKEGTQYKFDSDEANHLTPPLANVARIVLLPLVSQIAVRWLNTLTDILDEYITEAGSNCSTSSWSSYSERSTFESMRMSNPTPDSTGQP
jgi:hypothetical protein